jgi:hypothetical protein
VQWFLAIMSLDPTGQRSMHWTNRWPTAGCTQRPAKPRPAGSRRPGTARLTPGSAVMNCCRASRRLQPVREHVLAFAVCKQHVRKPLTFGGFALAAC